VLKDFSSSWYAGAYCGVTVFTLGFSIEKSLLFYMIALPMVDTINAMGVPTFLRFDSTHST
jgi:hypothetical protein